MVIPADAVMVVAPLNAPVIARVETFDTALELIVTPPILFDDAVPVVIVPVVLKEPDVVLLLLLIVVAPDRAPVIARVETPDTALALMVTPPILFEEAVGVTKLLAVDVLVLLIVVAPLNAPLLIIRPLIVFTVVGAVIAPKLTLPVVKIALHPAVVGALTVNVSKFGPNDVLDTVNVLAPLLIDDAVILPVNSVTPPIMLDALVVVMAPLAPSPLTFSVVPFHVSPEFALIVPGLPDVVIR